MKKIALITALAMTMSLAGCGEVAEIGMSNVTSEVYSDEEMDSFVMRIDAEVARNEGYLESVRYYGDEICGQEEILAKLSECAGVPVAQGEIITECVGFCLEYHADRGFVDIVRDIFHGRFRIDPDRYNDRQLWFVRTEGGEEFRVFFGNIDMNEYEISEQ